jgi:transposase
MGLFFKELVNILDKKRPKWRDNHVIIIDNAPYHNSQKTLEYLEELRVPMMFLAPYSYDTAPCELFFAYFK